MLTTFLTKFHNPLLRLRRVWWYTIHADILQRFFLLHRLKKVVKYIEVFHLISLLLYYTTLSDNHYNKNQTLSKRKTPWMVFVLSSICNTGRLVVRS